MRIELNSGGLSSGAAMLDFRSDLDSLIDRSQRMISGFQTIRSFANNMNGGIGDLQNAVDQIESRASTEETKTNALDSIRSRSDSFMELARKVDLNVGVLVNRNKEEFYDLNSWSRPPQTEEEKNLFQKGWDWLCEKGQQFVDDVNKFKDSVVSWGRSAAETISKAWNNAVEWFNENKDFIKQVAIEVAIGAAVIGLAALTGGASLVAIAACTSALIGGATKGIDYYAKNGTLKGAAKDIIGGAAKGFMTGSIEGYIFGGAKMLTEGHKIGRVATALIGSGTSGGSTFIGETIHAVSDGDGITDEEWDNIKVSSFVSVVTGGVSEFKGYKEIPDPSKADAFATLHSNSEFVKDQVDAIKSEALTKMRQGTPGSIYLAQEKIKDLKAFNSFLSNQIIKKEVAKSGLKIAGSAISTGINAGLRNGLSQILSETISDKTKFVDIKFSVEGLGKSFEETMKSTAKLWIKNLVKPTEVM